MGFGIGTNCHTGAEDARKNSEIPVHPDAAIHLAQWCLPNSLVAALPLGARMDEREWPRPNYRIISNAIWPTAAKSPYALFHVE